MAFDFLTMLFSNPETRRAMTFINEQFQEFWLTGSRFFGHSDERSDWDFFTEYTPHMEACLVEAGFQVFDGRHEPTYIGMQKCHQIYILGGVQVQLIEGAAEKNWLQLQIKRTVNMGSLNKDQRKQVWKLAYQIVTTMKGMNNVPISA
jgi:hypothetical protein